MREIIADVERTVVSSDGHEYYVQVAGEPLASGWWAAWLEFVPLDDSRDVLVTKTETTQPTREDVVRWSAILTDVYVQGAFRRAVRASTDRGVIQSYPTTAAGAVAPFDPFDVFSRGAVALRVRLRALTRPELVAMIEQYRLNPAGKSSTRLSDSQLVTFIVTAVEVQALHGKP